jgi:hypothetical protein
VICRSTLYLALIHRTTFPQVVAAVGFKGRRLEIPKDLNPQVAALIESCWAKYVFAFLFSFVKLIPLMLG